MFRTLIHLLKWSALLTVCLGIVAAASAQMPPSDYAAVVLRARVLDRLGHPVPHLPLRFTADLQGVALQDDGQGEGVSCTLTRTVSTDAMGLASCSVSGLPWTREAAWFRGRVTQTVSLPHDPSREIAPLESETASETEDFPADGPVDCPTLRVYEEPNRIVGGFPLWTATRGKMDKIVVVLEGFDLYNRISATNLMELISPAADALRAQGVGVLVVHFPDSHLTPDKLAPHAVEAIQTAARLSGHRVAVVGLSAGGIIARWALVQAEELGAPLPVHTFLSMDCPNRGAWLNPQLQAIVLRYGTPADKAALASEAAQVLLKAQPADVRWKWIGLPLMGRAMPVETRADSSPHDAFYERLHRLNDHNGYPKQCRLIGVASGCRQSVSADSSLFKLWVPFTYGWTLRAYPEDHAPGSMLPPYYVGRFTTVYPLGMAGATLRTSPTFIPTASALDAGPTEAPPFDSWYALPDNTAAISHDSVNPDEAKFVVQALLAGDWKS